jgi:non-specific serine/threonine protein kinase/serine/threonine-protein kinase
MSGAWIEVRDILDTVLELSPEERSLYLDEAQLRPELRRYVESLVFSYEQANEFLERTAVLGPTSLWEEGPPAEVWIGRRLGAYRIEEEIGHGGMGAVFRAVRVDDEYRKEVAIKLAKEGFRSGFAFERFRVERQILAALDHPNIARLLDGGRTEEGFPYLVMELVDGVPIDAYCDANKYSIDERLRLFRTVCGAVEFAHENLVVHRDLKPANILVTREGTPKLLDFGIAKLLSPESFPSAPEQTIGFMRMLTPEYASPEQMRGDNITTATDVYSLGVVLYQLLTGHSPHRLSGSSQQALSDIVCNVEPAKPSIAVGQTPALTPADGENVATATPASVSVLRSSRPEKLRRRLSGDLDNIVLMALRKDPRRRYSSVDQFSDDIRRHLEGLPVRAVADTLTYRASRFMKRHTLAVTASVIFVITLLGGITATVREARIARIERAKTERRFQDVRNLANSLIFDIHDSIKDLPGATPARKVIVERALKYLDSLSGDAGGDPALQQELATAYERVGDVQGNSRYSNLGDTEGALASYRKAAGIRESLLAKDPNNIALKWSLWGNYVATGWVLEARHQFQDELISMRKAMALAESLLPQAKDAKELDRLAGSYYALANGQHYTGDPDGALQSYQRAIAIEKSAVAASPASAVLIRSHLAGDYSGAASILADQNKFSVAIDDQRQATTLLEGVAAANPTNATARGFLADSYQFTGEYLLGNSNLEESLHQYRHAQTMYQELMVSDPTNVVFPYRLGHTNLGIGKVLMEQGKPSEALESEKAAVAIMRRLTEAHPDNGWDAQGLVEATLALGDAYRQLAQDSRAPATSRLANWQRARNSYGTSQETLSKAQARGEIVSDRGKELATLGSQGVAACDQQIAKLEGTRLARE